MHQQLPEARANKNTLPVAIVGRKISGFVVITCKFFHLRYYNIDTCRIEINAVCVLYTHGHMKCFVSKQVFSGKGDGKRFRLFANFCAMFVIVALIQHLFALNQRKGERYL